MSDFGHSVGLRYEGPLRPLDGIYIYSKDYNTSYLQNEEECLVNMLNQFKEKSIIQWYEKQIPRRRERRGFEIKDPLYPVQWHLHGMFKHINVIPVWDQGILGNGVRIAIIDDGIQTMHPDIRDNFKSDSSYNFITNNRDVEPTESTSWHGTASAGIAAARDDALSCGVGVAPRAEIAGIVVLKNISLLSDADEAAAFAYMLEKNDIYSIGWGPSQPGVNGIKNEAPGILAQKAILTGIQKGRDGKGSIYVWASGDDGDKGDTCNYDGYANQRYVILVGATDKAGNRPSYSEYCAALAVVSPGGTLEDHQGIVTCDLLDSDGNSDDNCTTMVGTSASCAIVSGVISLILEVNPELTWLEVQYVLAEATKKT
jgi:subtilisin family serine protease